MPQDEILAALAKVERICRESTNCQKRSQYFMKDSQGYGDSVRHCIGSSSEIAEAAVQPGSSEDLSKIMKVLAEHKIPFAIKGGGHATNPLFSSTRGGLQICMSRFGDISYDSATENLSVGAGCLWDSVYHEIHKHGRNIVGAAIRGGVGVAGYLLGGGYSLKTNRFGLGIDNVTGFEIVLPDGRILDVSEEQEGDLFWALKGGGNNFGIVTRFTLKTHHQGLAFRSPISVRGEDVEKVKAAIVDFAMKERDPRASLVAKFRYALEQGKVQFSMSVLCCFDGEDPSTDHFSQFRAICPDADWGFRPAGWGRTAPIQASDFRRIPQNWLSGVEISDGDIQTMQNVSQPGTGNARPSNDTAMAETDGAANWAGAMEISEEDFESDGASRANNVSITEEEFVSAVGGGVGDEEKGDNWANGAEISEEEFAAALGRWSEGAHLAGQGFGGAPFQQISTRGLEDSKFDGYALPTPVMTPKERVGETNSRGRFGCIMINFYNKALVDAVAEQAARSAQHLEKFDGTLVLIDVWPFHPTIFDNSTPSAWPHVKGKACGPLPVYFLWKNAEHDDFWIAEMKGALKTIQDVAIKEKCATDDLPIYCNTSLEDTPPELIYRGNLERLKQIRAKYDPQNVMGNTGGFRIPLPNA